MRIELTSRGLLSVFFRQHLTFLTVFLLIAWSGIAYIYFAKPVYEAAGSLLVKFGHDATSEIIRPEGGPEVISQNDRRETMQSNMDILQSHNLLLKAIHDIGVERLYPGISARVAGSDLPEEAVVRELSKNDLAIKSSQQSNVIDVQLMNQNPKVAAQFIHHLFELFIARQSEMYNKPQTDFLQEQIKQAGSKLDYSQQQLEEFKARTGISSINDELSQLLRQKGDAGTVSLDSMDDAWTKLADLETEETQMLATYQQDSPQVRRIQESVALAKSQLHLRQADLAARTGKAKSQIDKRIAELETLRNEYNDLARQVEIDEENYKNYKLRSEEARINETLNQKNITSIAVVDEPIVPMKPVRPRKLMILALCLLGGIVFGTGAALASETYDQRFTTPEQVSLALGLPVMASFGTDGERSA